MGLHFVKKLYNDFDEKFKSVQEGNQHLKRREKGLCWGQICQKLPWEVEVGSHGGLWKSLPSYSIEKEMEEFHIIYQTHKS